MSKKVESVYVLLVSMEIFARLVTNLLISIFNYLVAFQRAVRTRLDAIVNIDAMTMKKKAAKDF